jgi:N-acetylneuraminate synthase
MSSSAELIIEIGQAHDGSLGILHSYIDSFSKTGADVIKFQMHLAEAESSEFEPFRVNFSYEDKTRYDYWKRMSFTFEQWQGIKSHCDEVGVEFLCTPFSIKALDWLEQLNVKRHKIASGEVTNLLMLDMLAEIGKPVLLSSGMSDFSELDNAVSIFRGKGVETSIFQCTTSYPTPPERVGINVLAQLKERYNCPIGLSDHSGSIFPALAAVSQGAEMVEVHGVFDKGFFGPDSGSSLTISEIQTLRQGFDFIGKLHQSPVDKDDIGQYKELRKVFGKSLGVRADLPKDHIITRADLEAKKSGGRGIDARDYYQVIGKKLTCDKAANSFLALTDIAEN